MLLVILVVAVLVVVAVALPAVGLFLVVADPLGRSDAIFVLDGHTPARELEAAALYHRGLAPLVVVTFPRDPMPERARRLAGEPVPQERAARVLMHLRVPARAIVRLREMVDNSEQELRVDYELARARGFRRVILVTSPAHTRRIQLIWRTRYGGRIPALVHPTPYEDFVPERWWRSGRALEASAHELFGMLNFVLGNPLRTFDRGT